MSVRLFALLTLFCPFSLSMAAEVHQHGVAQLDMVVEPPLVAIGIHSPLANLVGFEHHPSSATEQQAWHQLQTDLRQAAQLFMLPAAADCSLSRVDLHLPFGATPAQHAHDHDHPPQDAHTGLMAEYQLLCANPAALTQVELPLMTRFPAIEQLQVQLITPGGQHSTTLHAGETRLSLP